MILIERSMHTVSMLKMAYLKLTRSRCRCQRGGVVDWMLCVMLDVAQPDHRSQKITESQIAQWPQNGYLHTYRTYRNVSCEVAT